MCGMFSLTTTECNVRATCEVLGERRDAFSSFYLIAWSRISRPSLRSRKAARRWQRRSRVATKRAATRLRGRPFLSRRAEGLRNLGRSQCPSFLLPLVRCKRTSCKRIPCERIPCKRIPGENAVFVAVEKDYIAVLCRSGRFGLGVVDLGKSCSLEVCLLQTSLDDRR